VPPHPWPPATPCAGLRGSIFPPSTATARPAGISERRNGVSCSGSLGRRRGRDRCCWLPPKPWDSAHHRPFAVSTRRLGLARLGAGESTPRRRTSNRFNPSGHRRPWSWPQHVPPKSAQLLHCGATGRCCLSCSGNWARIPLASCHHRKSSPPSEPSGVGSARPSSAHFQLLTRNRLQSSSARRGAPGWKLPRGRTNAPGERLLALPDPPEAAGGSLRKSGRNPRPDRPANRVASIYLYLSGCSTPNKAANQAPAAAGGQSGYLHRGHPAELIPDPVKQTGTGSHRQAQGAALTGSLPAARHK